MFHLKQSRRLAVLVIVVSLASAAAISALPSFFSDATVEAVDPWTLSLTVRSHDGDVWTLPVTSMALIKELKPGERVDLELDQDAHVMKIIKKGAHPAPSHHPG